MRVLLKNDGVLHCMKVEHAYVCPDDNELILENADQYVTVSNITPHNAEAAVRFLFQEGMADLTLYDSDI